MISRRTIFRFFAWGALALFPLGCSESLRPQSGTGDGTATIDGSIDPDKGDFVLTTLTTPGEDGTPVQIELIGSSLTVDPALERVSLLVSLRNADHRTLYAPAEIRVGDFVPFQAYLLEADWVVCPHASSTDPRPASCWYGILYSDLLGDGALEPGETSAPRTWTFASPGLNPFSFSATARVGMAPDRPQISGIYYFDHDWSGTFTTGDTPYAGGAIEIQTPGDGVILAQTQEDGRYAVPITEPGLYTLTAQEPPLGSPLPIHYTTPNPLHVLLPPGPDGRPDSFDHADFGMGLGFPPGPPPVMLFEGSPDSLIQDAYGLLEGRLDGTTLHLRVGYSGCQPEHPFALYMVGGFMESNPVQARLVLSHNSLGEACEAYWVGSLAFDLRPIQEAYHKAYGRLDPVILRLGDPSGQIHTFTLLP